MTHGTEPFRFWVLDDAAKTLPVDVIPPPSWGGWEAHYENDCERGKRTTRQFGSLPAVRGTLDALRSAESVAYWSERVGLELEDDPTLHGGGLHVMAPGGRLAVHLDYDRHPVYHLPRRRALNIVAFLHPAWQSAWGGALQLCDPLGEPVVSIEPAPGRLVAFEVSDLSYHGVEPVTGPAERVSVALSLLAPAGPANVRLRALFLPTRKPVESQPSIG